MKADLDRVSGKNFTNDPTLETAVMISLFTRRLAAMDDALPDPKGPREGWWADPYNNVEGDNLGSRLWLLCRAKMTQSTLTQAENYAKEALQWLIDDKIADAVDVLASKNGSLLILQVSITKPDNPATQWAGIWSAHLALL